MFQLFLKDYDSVNGYRSGMDAKTALGQLIRASRGNRYTQQELAKKAGITYQYLSGVESGKENFTIDVLEALGEALGFSLPRLVIEAFYGSLSATPPLRHGSMYLNPNIDYSRWKRPASGTIPPHSVFHPTNLPPKAKRRKK